MLISYRWLQRHVDLSGVSADEVAERLTLHTAEVEGVLDFAPALSQVVVGHVLERAPHEGADKLGVCRVDLGAAGDGTPVQIVCGAQNVAAGHRVAVARVGAVLPGDFRIKKSKIRGVESFGMICSERELALGDEHSGIWLLPDDSAVGATVSDALGTADRVLEIDNKTITHRPDLWGHRGVAGELAAILGRELLPLDLAWPATADGEPYPVRVESDGCERYLGLPIDGLVNGRAPEWMRLLLLAVDQRPLDLFVDVSNFVMLDLGQPNHLFDRRRLDPSGILVRDARPGERMVTLDEEERVLEPGDVLICSGDEPVALAGLMGGEASKVAPDTTELLLEVASFRPARIRRTSSRLGLRTDASARFEKHLTPTLPAAAAAHVVNLLRAACPDLRLPGPAGDAGDWTDPARTVTLRPGRLRAVLGLDVADDAIAATLGGLGFGVGRDSGESWSVAVPSERATKDVGLEEDLIEEVGRMHGYGDVPEAELVASVAPPPRDLRRELVRKVQDRLAGSARFHEVLSYSYHHDDLLRTVGLLERRHMRMRNPIVDGGTRVRRSVLPSLIGILAKNRRLTDDVRLFEIGKGYLPELLNEEGGPTEVHELALAWVAPRAASQQRFDSGTFFRLRGVVEDLLGAVGLAAPTWEAGTRDAAPPYLHPGKWVHASYGGSTEPAVVLGNLEPGLVRALGLHGEQDGDVAVAELSLDGVLAADGHGFAYQPLPKYPGVKVDVALAVDDATPAAAIAECITAAGKGLVADLELFDLYRGESIGAGRKSLAYHVLLQAQDRTLSDKEAAKFLGRVERGIETLGGQLRKD